MTTLEKLERRIRECDLTVKHSLSYGAYDFAAAEERDLLEEAVSRIRELEFPTVFIDAYAKEAKRARTN